LTRTAPVLSEKRKDAVAAAVIRGGGVLVILAVVAIVANIGLQSLPLLGGARTEGLATVATPETPVLAGTEARQEAAWVLDRRAAITFPSRPDWPVLHPFGGEVPVAAADMEGHGLIAILGTNGQVAVGEVRVSDRWQDGERLSSARWKAAADVLELDSEVEWGGVTANGDVDGNLMLVAWSGARPPVVRQWSIDDEAWQNVEVPADALITTAAVAQELGALALVEREGRLRVFDRDRVGRISELEVTGLSGRVEQVRYLIGGGTLIAAAADGVIQVLLAVPRVRVRNSGSSALRVANERIEPGEEIVVPDDEIGRKLASVPSAELVTAAPVMKVVRTLPEVGGTPSAIAPSPRRRGFLVGTATGRIALYHATSGRRLVHDQWTEDPIRSLAFAPKADGLVAAVDGGVLRREIVNPHPEVSLRTLFLPVWYEGYARPQMVWQSTGGSDSFEPKLSLWPLIFGTFKATLYAMIVSVPLALLAALYVSQLGPVWFRSLVKPIVELMAAVPSVVVGFLAALWLAPRLERALLTTITAALSLPIAVVLALLIWRVLPAGLRRRLEGAAELVVPLLAAAIVLGVVAVAVRPLESAVFGGDFTRWLFSTAGFRYDQRNSLVVGIALGFAVIPVIFTIAEDAFSSVPRSLVNASRSLGASRWQTARHLVVPAASAGVFAAVILGLGRAVGETMIVLMAAGNTPLLDLSPFNGMRTMSAAIAVEIPEAPVGGTLFRVLFLTGFLLFGFTLVLTTVADQVGRIMRRKYGAQ
jgi:phosphate transport system permease protein